MHLTRSHLESTSLLGLLRDETCSGEAALLQQGEIHLVQEQQTARTLLANSLSVAANMCEDGTGSWAYRKAADWFGLEEEES